jgi:hypothetical protein
MKRHLLGPLLAALAFAAPARAATFDMGSQTCQDWLDAGEDEQDQMVAWLRGFLAGRSSITLLDLSALRGDGAALKRYCQTHLTVGLISAAGQWRH